MIIAEIGVNHGGDLPLAFRMIELANENGADLAKFQLFDVNKIVWPTPQIQAEAVRSAITRSQAEALYQHGNKTGIEVFFSVFDTEKVQWCEDIGVSTYKVASSRAYDPELLTAVYETGKLMIQSIPAIVSVKLGDVASRPCFMMKNIIRLYCIAEYPAIVTCLPPMGINYEYHGFSDHSIGIEGAKKAFDAGAIVVEKHFSIDHHTGMDSAWAMDPGELKELHQWERKRYGLSSKPVYVQPGCLVSP